MENNFDESFFLQFLQQVNMCDFRHSDSHTST